MKYRNFINNMLVAAMVALATTACDDAIEAGGVSVPDTGDATGELLYVSDANGNTAAQSVEMRESTQVPLYLNITSATGADQSVKISYDATALDAYNRANGGNVQAIPESFVSFENDGIATLPAGQVKSEPINMTITSDGSLDHDASYAVPLSVSLAGGNATVAATSAKMVVLVRDLSALPDCVKMVDDGNGNMVRGVKIFSCMEVNDTNPLNNLKYTLKNSGKYLIDALIMFSSNINYDSSTGKVILYHNENVSALLDNREKYLKPLKDRGMKVYLSILCNHTIASIHNLSDETCRYFAQQIKACCDAYDLDGVFYDCEYCNPEYGNYTPGFVAAGQGPVSRLLYEVWKLQPERDNIAYVYSATRSLSTVDGVQAGTYCKYALHDYGGSSDLSNNYPGMPRSNMGLHSQEFNRGYWAAKSSLVNMRQNGYGSHMVFAMDPNRSNVASQENALRNCAEAFYDDELVVDPTNYAKDW